MAKVTKIHSYLITLTSDEAEFLFDVLRNIAGNIDKSPRQHADAIVAALEKVKIKTPPYSGEGGITYADYK